MILRLLRIERPVAFFTSLFVVLATTSVLLAIPIAVTFIETGLVPRLPTALLATGIMLLAFMCLFSGLILDTVTRGRQEAKRMHYLSIQAPAGESATVVMPANSRTVASSRVQS